jgi:hypothetical protein
MTGLLTADQGEVHRRSRRLRGAGGRETHDRRSTRRYGPVRRAHHRRAFGTRHASERIFCYASSASRLDATARPPVSVEIEAAITNPGGARTAIGDIENRRRSRGLGKPRARERSASEWFLCPFHR